MSSVEQLKDFFGKSPCSEDRDLDLMQIDLGVTIPEDVKAVCSRYGDVLISDFIFIFGSEFMVAKGVWMSDCVRDGHPEIPGAWFPM